MKIRSHTRLKSRGGGRAWPWVLGGVVHSQAPCRDHFQQAFLVHGALRTLYPWRPCGSWGGRTLYTRESAMSRALTTFHARKPAQQAFLVHGALDRSEREACEFVRRYFQKQRAPYTKRCPYTQHGSRQGSARIKIIEFHAFQRSGGECRVQRVLCVTHRGGHKKSGDTHMMISSCRRQSGRSVGPGRQDSRFLGGRVYKKEFPRAGGVGAAHTSTWQACVISVLLGARRV